MKKKHIMAIVCLFICFMIIIFYKKHFNDKVEFSDYALTDSKFFGDVIMSGNNGHLIFLDKEGNILKEHEDVLVNWICGDAQAGVIIAGNVQYELRKIEVDSEYNVISNKVLFKSEYLMIDPTIVQLEDGTWILSYVEIQGTVNNADANCENGVYTVYVYKSRDLCQWEFVSNPVSEKRNIEDGDMFELDEKVYYLYEKESLDK